VSTHEEQAFLLALDAAIDALASQAPTARTAEASSAAWLAGLLDEAIPAPSTTAKARGKARLLVALATIEQEEAAPALARWQRWFAAQPRWALASGAAVLAVAAGTATMASAQRSLPGQPLHAIKRASEDVALAAANDKAQLASLNMRLAAERANEASRLLLAGDIAAATPLAQSMAAFVAGAVLASGGVEDPAQAVALAKELAATAQSATASLQTAAQWSSGGGQDAARHALAEASALYAGAVEQALGVEPAAGGMGSVSVRVSLPDGAAGTLLSTEVYRPSKGWQRVSAQDATTTVPATGAGQVPVATAPVESGTYTRVRLSFADDPGEANAGTGTSEEAATNVVETRRPFSVSVDTETVVSVDLTKQTPVLFTYPQDDAPPPVTPSGSNTPKPQGTAPQPPAPEAPPGGDAQYEQPKAEEREVKDEQPKAEQHEAKDEEPKAEPQREVKDEQPKAEPQREVKDEQPKAEPQREAKDEQPKAEPQREAKDEQPKAEPQREAKDEEPKAEEREAKDEEPKAEEREAKEQGSRSSSKGKRD
jgi:hypothetical protein